MKRLMIIGGLLLTTVAVVFISTDLPRAADSQDPEHRAMLKLPADFECSMTDMARWKAALMDDPEARSIGVSNLLPKLCPPGA